MIEMDTDSILIIQINVKLTACPLSELSCITLYIVARPIIDLTKEFALHMGLLSNPVTTLFAGEKHSQPVATEYVMWGGL